MFIWARIKSRTKPKFDLWTVGIDSILRDSYWLSASGCEYVQKTSALEPDLYISQWLAKVPSNQTTFPFMDNGEK